MFGNRSETENYIRRILIGIHVHRPFFVSYSLPRGMTLASFDRPLIWILTKQKATQQRNKLKWVPGVGSLKEKLTFFSGESFNFWRFSDRFVQKLSLSSGHSLKLTFRQVFFVSSNAKTLIVICKKIALSTNFMFRSNLQLKISW